MFRAPAVALKLLGPLRPEPILTSSDKKRPTAPRGRSCGPFFSELKASELEAQIQIVLTTVVIERGGSGGALVVSQRRRVEVQRIQADTHPVRRLVVERQRHRTEIVLVIRVGTRQADQELAAIRVRRTCAELLVLEIRTHVVGVLR